MEDELCVNRELIDQWIYENRPDGLSKLAVVSGVPSDTVAKARRGKVPSKIQRQKLAEALKHEEEKVFPLRASASAVS